MADLGPTPQSSAPLARTSSKSRRRGRRASLQETKQQKEKTEVVDYYYFLSDHLCGAVTDANTLLSIQQETGAVVRLAETPSSVPDTTCFLIRGSRAEIEAAVQTMCKKTGLQGSLASQAQEFWLQWVKEAYPDLDSRAYFHPAVFIRRVPVRGQEVAGHPVLVPDQAIMSPEDSTEKPVGQARPVHGSDVRDDEAMERVFLCLKRLAEEHDEVFMCVNQLQFQEYLGDPCYAAAAAHLPVPTCLPSSMPWQWKRGDFDLLLIHRQYGLVVFEVKSFGGNVKELNMTQEEMDTQIQRKLQKASNQLKKAEAMLSHLVSDIASGLRITKVIALPSITLGQVKKAQEHNAQLVEEVCRCLGTKDAAGILQLCLCSDHLPASEPLSGSMFEVVWKVWDWWHGRVAGRRQANLLGELWRWWQRCVAGALPDYWQVLPKLWRRRASRRRAGSDSKEQAWPWWQRCLASAGPDPLMNLHLYEMLVARFCGPATTVSVPCTTSPRLALKTRGHAVSATGQCFTADIALFPEQVDLLTQRPARLFLTGPPGTGKTVVLLLMATVWLQLDRDVYVVSTWENSRVSCRMLHHLLQQKCSSHPSVAGGPQRLHYLQYDLHCEEDLKKAVDDLADVAVDGALNVVADDVGPDFWQHSQPFQTFCEELLARVPDLRLWGASCQHRHTPRSWQKVTFTRSLRCPPVVVREVAQAPQITRYDAVASYSVRGVPDHTDGPPVKWVFHRGAEHPGWHPINCVRCGEEVARFLRSLCVGARVAGNLPTPGSGGTSLDVACPPSLQYKDVILLCWGAPDENLGLVRSLDKAGIPVRVMRDDDDEGDVAAARSDVIWVAQGDRVRGVERKVVVAVGHNVPRLTGIYHRLDWISRCTAQLVWVVPLPADVDVSRLLKR